jgi:CRISPR type III-associated protein (TIGR04423 family)
MKINKAIYEGYIWYSNEKEPEVIDNKDFEINIPDTQNPFIIEGQLFDRNNQKSYSIKFVDGEYLVTTYDLSKQGNNYEKKEFLSNRMDNRILLFRQYWKEEKDELCCGMTTLHPAEFVFVGFKKDKED